MQARLCALTAHRDRLVGSLASTHGSLRILHSFGQCDSDVVYKSLL